MATKKPVPQQAEKKPSKKNLQPKKNNNPKTLQEAIDKAEGKEIPKRPPAKTKKKASKGIMDESEHWHFKGFNRNKDEVTFLNALANGLGLSRSAQMSGFTPKEISEQLLEDEVLMTLADEALLQASQMVLIVSNKAKRNKDYDTWKLNQQTLERLIVQLVMWEEYTPKEFITQSKVMQAIVIYKYPEEIATSLGLTMPEYVVYMMQHEHIYKSIEQNIGVTGLK